MTPRRFRASAPGCALIALLVLGLWGIVEAFQGMASPKRIPKPTARVKTDLPPITGGSSYISQNDARVHVGLSASDGYDRIEVLWPGGVREQFPGGKADRLVPLTQGTGRSNLRQARRP